MSIIPISVSSVHTNDFEKSDNLTADRLAYHNDGGWIEDHAPGWDADRFEPSPESEIQESGYRIGYELNWAAKAPSELSSFHQLCWTLGKVDGTSDRLQNDADREAFEADLAESTHSSMGHHPDEAVRSIGVVASREIGGNQ